MEKNARIHVAGHTGLVGSALLRALRREGFTQFILRTSKEVDLRDPSAVARLYQAEQPQYVFLAAARVGGILANAERPADFAYDNQMIACNVIHEAWRCGVKKLLFLGSTCIYPRDAPQPIPEEALLTGPLEPTNQAYAVAKIAGISLCQAYQKQYGCWFISAMPTNLYGPGDNFDLHDGHVLPALIRRFEEARVERDRTVTLWGSGAPRREFLHVDDLAGACLLLMDKYKDPMPVNVGSGMDMTIRELAELVARVVGYRGEIRFDASKPDGTPRKLADSTRLRALGWKPHVGLEEGITETVMWYRKLYARGEVGACIRTTGVRSHM